MWVFLRRFKVREHERGLLFEDREFKRVLRPGRHFVWDLLRKVRVDVVSVREVWLNHKDLDVIAKSPPWVTRPGSWTSRTTSGPSCGWTAVSRRC